MRRAILAALTVAAVYGRAPGALLDAVRSDDLVSVERLLKEGADVNEREPDGGTPLAGAATRSNTAIAAVLLKAGANPNIGNELGLGPLAIAIANGSLEMVDRLLAARADANTPRENGETPLMTAARMGRVDMMKLLLAKGAAPNGHDKKFGQTALMWAAGNPDAVRLLLAHGADTKAVTKTWDVKYTIYLPTTATLGKTGIPWNNEGNYTAKKGGLNALFFAIQKNDVESARLLLDAGIDVNSTAADGTTPLLAALYKWDAPKGTFVPGRGAPAAAGSSQRFAPNIALANLFLDRGAKVQLVDGAGYTPLHGAALAVAKAARSGNRQKGAYGQNAAALALGSDDAGAAALPDALNVVRRILAAGGDPNRQTIYPTGGPAGDVRINPAPPGSSPMHIAASSTSVELIQLLNDKGGDPNLVRKDGHTPFSVAIIAGDVPIVKELASRGANVTGRWSPHDKIPDPVEAITLARQNQTALHLAAIEGKPELLEFLASKGVSLTAKNSANETPLDLADHQERYREAIQRQGADGDQEKLKKVVRVTRGSDTLKRLAASHSAE
ncbi:MAG TPA: ankyrin repeat domain-containing protein [Bryobacteraceae bacterium]|nr:ankyrin repeat domain-containing protein [Bryobacteraceae bacterium]